MAVITDLSVCKSQLYILSSDHFKIVLAGGDGDIILSAINPSIHFFQDTDRFGVRLDVRVAAVVVTAGLNRI